MQKWEFRLMAVERSVGVAEIKWNWSDEAEGLPGIEDKINEWGQRGWELFSVAPVNGLDGITTQMHLWLKRPISEDMVPDDISGPEGQVD